MGYVSAGTKQAVNQQRPCQRVLSIFYTLVSIYTSAQDYSKGMWPTPHIDFMTIGSIIIFPLYKNIPLNL